LHGVHDEKNLAVVIRDVTDEPQHYEGSMKR
jgi:hypothetical protein